MEVSSMRMRYSLTKLPELIPEIGAFTLPAITNEEVECPVTNHFDEGVYLREVTLPTNSYILGKKHKHSCINILSKGKLLLIDITTGERQLLEAPYTFVSNAGVQKLAYIIEECVWINVHTNIDNTRDLDVLEDRLIEKEEGYVLGNGRNGCSISSISNARAES